MTDTDGRSSWIAKEVIEAVGEFVTRQPARGADE
jgi:hypothetical protein